MVEGFVAQSVADELSVATVSNQGVIAGYLNAFCFFGVQAFVLCSIIVASQALHRQQKWQLCYPYNRTQHKRIASTLKPRYLTLFAFHFIHIISVVGVQSFVWTNFAIRQSAYEKSAHGQTSAARFFQHHSWHITFCQLAR
jgi:hypothetical protein